MFLRIVGNGNRFIALIVIAALIGTCLVGINSSQAASSDSLNVFLKQMKDADTALSQADKYFANHKDQLFGGIWSEESPKYRDTFIALLEKGERSLAAALRSKYSYNPKYIDLFNKLKIYKVKTILHVDESGVDFVRTFVSENYACYSAGCQGAPISSIMQVKYRDGHADVLTTHGEFYGSDTSDIIDQRVTERYGFFQNKNNETMMIMQFDNWRGGGWNIKVYNLTKKKEEKITGYIPLTSLPAALSSKLKGSQKSLLGICDGGECTSQQDLEFSITKIDEANRTITLGKAKISLKNVSRTAIKPNLKKQNLIAVIDAAMKGTFPNIKITLESTFDEVKKVYGPLNQFEGGTYYLKSFQFEADDNGRLSGMGTSPKQVGLASITLADLENLLQIKAVKGAFEYDMELQAGQYKLTFSGSSLSKPITRISIYR